MGPYPQSVIFQYNKDNDRFTISRMGGYRIDQKEAIKAGMRQTRLLRYSWKGCLYNRW